MFTLFKRGLYYVCMTDTMDATHCPRCPPRPGLRDHFNQNKKKKELELRPSHKNKKVMLARACTKHI
jgi:hypothetical protein